MKSLIIVSTHPIQYYAPIFQLLAKESNIRLKVLYTWGSSSLEKYDPGFGKKIIWDIPILDGYDFEFLENSAKNKGSHHFFGIKNPDIITKINNFNPDAILVFGWAYHSHLKVIKHFKNKIPVWFRGDSTLLNEISGVKSLLKDLFLKWVYKSVDKAFFVGSANKAYYRRFGLSKNQLIYAPHAVDNDRFSKPQLEKSIEIRKKLSLSEKDILILFAGKLEYVKNPFLLLESFELLKNETIYLLFVGNGVLEKDLKQKAKTISKENKIHFMDFQNQSMMPAIYQSCNFFCLPSISETWGLAVNEAMSCGKPVIISDKVGCGIDLVQNNVNGYIFKNGDKYSLFDCLEKLTNDSEKLNSFGKASFNKIQTFKFEYICGAIKKELELTNNE